MKSRPIKKRNLEEFVYTLLDGQELLRYKGTNCWVFYKPNDWHFYSDFSKPGSLEKIISKETAQKEFPNAFVK